MEFLAEGTAKAKAPKQERAQAFWGLKEERGWGEGGVTEKDSLLPRRRCHRHRGKQAGG